MQEPDDDRDDAEVLQATLARHRLTIADVQRRLAALKQRVDALAAWVKAIDERRHHES